MRRVGSCRGRSAAVIAMALAAWGVLACSESTREEAVAPAPAPSAAPGAEAAAAAEPAAFSSDDVKALVSPVALFPDPLLALVLQASTQPLQMVAADRFLSVRAQDPSAAPDAGWDSSVVGLLNYPDLVTMMSDSLDWTEGLGGAVVGQLGDVQRSVQEIRWSAYNLGILQSNDVQRVLVAESVIAIVPEPPDRISIPSYDGAALLEAIESGTVTQAATVQTATAEPSAAEAPTATEVAPEAAPRAEGTTVPDAAYAPALAPVYAAAPAAYAVPVTYSEPQSSFWTNAAIFGGGAVVGGLLGYAIGDDDDDDDDDDHHHHYYGGDWDDDWGHGGGRSFKADDIKIEGNTVVINNPDRTQKQLRDRGGVEPRPAGRPGKTPAREVKLPGPAGKPAKPMASTRSATPKPIASTRPATPKPVGSARPATPKPVARPASPKPVAKPGEVRRDQAGALGDRASPPQVARERDRGERTRDVAAASREARPPAARDATASRDRQRDGGGGIAGRHEGGGKAEKQADRGAKSRKGEKSGKGGKSGKR